MQGHLSDICHARTQVDGINYLRLRRVVKYDPDAPKQRVCTLLLSQQTNLYQNYARGEEVRGKGSKKAALD